MGKANEFQPKGGKLNKSVLISAALIAVMLGVSGCGRIEAPTGRGPMSIQRSGDSLVVAVCQKVDEVVGIRGEARTDGDWTTFWDARGEVSITAGNSISEENIGDHLEVLVASSPSLDERTEIAIAVEANDPNDSLLGLFELDHTLGGSLWLHSNGVETERPC